MKQAFIIMQIGNSELDKVCEDSILPALRANDPDPKRVDKHNQGGLLKNEIISFIENSDIIVADLTNERPNCYLEIGYAMGVDKFRNLILTAREDHLPESPNYKLGGPKIHFDLSGYDILFWQPGKIDEFREELTKRIRRRLAVLTPSHQTQPLIWDEEWINTNHEKAIKGIADIGLKAYMEVRYALVNQKIDITQKSLLDAIEKAQIHTFGWPIGAVINNADYRPRPKADGIFAEISIKNRDMLSYVKNSYDYWVLRKNGDFYLLKNLFEDDTGGNKDKSLFFNTRIVRTTEVLLHCARLYANLGVPSHNEVALAIKYEGISNRRLSSTNNRRISYDPVAIEDQIEIVKQFSLLSIETQLVEKVKQFTAPLFALFDFFELSDSIYEDIVNQYVEGKVT